jgi:hypothetical protein
MGMARRSGRCLAVAGLLLTTALAGCTSARQAPARPASDGLGVVAVPERSATFDVLGYPQLVAAGAGAVWVTNRTPGTVTRIDVRRASHPVPGSGSASRPRALLCWPARPGSMSCEDCTSTSRPWGRSW